MEIQKVKFFELYWERLCIVTGYSNRLGKLKSLEN